MDDLKIDFKHVKDLKSCSERFFPESEKRQKLAQDRCTYGIPLLDDQLDGIKKNEFILVAARTGAGKTEFATHVAQANARLGKRVTFFALEADESEIERRIKFRAVATLCKELRKRNFQDIPYFDYHDWFMMKVNHITKRYEAEIEERLAEDLKTLSTFYRSYGDYTIDDFERQFLAYASNTDLMIVDHLHFFDMLEGESENEGLKRIAKKCRDLTTISGVPVLAIAHLRKTNKAHQTIMPELDEIHGSSDLSKIATTAITIARGDMINPSEKHFVPTLFQVAKCRMRGSLSRFVCAATFDLSQNTYKQEYVVGKTINQGKDWEPLTSEKIPHWAVGRCSNEV